MAIQQLNRTSLNNAFGNGERPTGDDFASAWLSCINQTDDGVSISDATNKNLKLFGGVTLGSPNAGAPGTLRYDGGSGQIQFTSDGVNFKNISSGAGAFLPVAGGPSVAFGAGNVGIGNFVTAPTHRLEISLGKNTDASQEVLLGNLAVHNGAANDGAYIGHTSLALDNAGFALLQDNVGNTTINAAAGGTLALGIGKTNLLTIIPLGLPTVPFLLSVEGNLTVGTQAKSQQLTLFGDAAKTGSLVWVSAPGSDARIKKDIKAYEEGLDKVIQLKPVTYKFNGKGGTFEDGKDLIGLIAQDVQKAIPDMVFSKLVKLNPEDEKETELLNYDFHNVLFMFINAFKEINGRLEKLEKSGKNEKRKTSNSTGVDH